MATVHGEVVTVKGGGEGAGERGLGGACIGGASALVFEHVHIRDDRHLRSWYQCCGGLMIHGMMGYMVMAVVA